MGFVSPNEHSRKIEALGSCCMLGRRLGVKLSWTALFYYILGLHSEDTAAAAAAALERQRGQALAFGVVLACLRS